MLSKHAPSANKENFILTRPSLHIQTPGTLASNDYKETTINQSR